MEALLLWALLLWALLLWELLLWELNLFGDSSKVLGMLAIAQHSWAPTKRWLIGRNLLP